MKRRLIILWTFWFCGAVTGILGTISGSDTQAGISFGFFLGVLLILLLEE